MFYTLTKVRDFLPEIRFVIIIESVDYVAGGRVRANIMATKKLL